MGSSPTWRGGGAGVQCPIKVRRASCRGEVSGSNERLVICKVLIKLVKILMIMGVRFLTVSKGRYTL